MPKEITSLTVPQFTKEITISQDWITRRDQLIEKATGVVVQDNVQFQAACDDLNAITSHSNALEKIRLSIGKPFADMAKKIKALADQARAPLETCKGDLKASINVWAEKERKREMEERKKAEEEAQIESERLLALQEKEADIFGEETVAEVPQVQAAPVAVAQRSSSAQVIQVVKVKSIDEDKIPRAFCSADPRKVNNYLREHREEIRKALEEDPEKGTEFIEGVVFVIETDTRSRG